MKTANAAEGRVLLADDDAMVARSMTRILERAGYQVFTASNGHNAAEILKGETFDVVLSDISMPGLTGLDLLAIVREHDLDLPVLLMTADPDMSGAIRAVDYGALKYLIKPITADALINNVALGVRTCKMARLKREALSLVGDVAKFVGDRAGLKTTFDRALTGLWMAFQPIVSPLRKEIFAYEALLRTSEPKLASPLDFLDAAEQLTSVQALGRAIRRTIAETCAKNPGTLVFVNLHPSDLADDALYAKDSPFTKLAPRVVLEITERAAFADVTEARRRVDELRRLGFRIALDDLGSGYAGLSWFTQLEPDIVKLDMSLVRGVDGDIAKQRVVTSMVSLCKDSGMLVVAEGVETAGERDALTDLGCDLLQGYLFAKPARNLERVAFEPAPRR